MGNLSLFLAVVSFSFISHAQIEFGGLIEENIIKQNELASDLSNAKQFASSQESTQDQSAQNQSQIKTDKEKDFTVVLKNAPTHGRARAQMYFPPKPPTPKHAKKNSKKTNSQVAKVIKPKKLASTRSYVANRKPAASIQNNKKSGKKKNKKATKKAALDLDIVAIE